MSPCPNCRLLAADRDDFRIRLAQVLEQRDAARADRDKLLAERFKDAERRSAKLAEIFVRLDELATDLRRPW